MLIVYFDEVKYEAGRQPYYWLGGLVVSADAIRSLEKKVVKLAEECFGHSTLSKETEFHAADIFHRKSNFKEWREISRRLDVLKSLIRIINEEESAKKIFVQLDPAKMIKPDYEQMAFMFFIEKVESYLRESNSPGLLIGDRESQKLSSQYAEVLSKYKKAGTPYHYGISKLELLVDTVHFTASHHSRMLQLADLCLWVRQLVWLGDEKSWPTQQILNFIKLDNRITDACRYKIWPTEDSWVKVLRESATNQTF